MWKNAFSPGGRFMSLHFVCSPGGRLAARAHHIASLEMPIGLARDYGMGKLPPNSGWAEQGLQDKAGMFHHSLKNYFKNYFGVQQVQGNEKLTQQSIGRSQEAADLKPSYCFHLYSVRNTT